MSAAALLRAALPGADVDGGATAATARVDGLVVATIAQRAIGWAWDCSRLGTPAQSGRVATAEDAAARCRAAVAEAVAANEAMAARLRAAMGGERE